MVLTARKITARTHEGKRATFWGNTVNNVENRLF